MLPAQECTPPTPSPSPPRRKPELWGGIECSVARVGDRYPDQLFKNGHQTRPGDIARIAELGIRTLRYPVLWERIAPTHPDQPDWAWTDARLAELRTHGINPIAGLLHHGSGPLYCTFDKPEFPEQFARFARRVAERYPWITHYNPVNEPLTTARFAGLYGHWYPHSTDDASFCRILLNQCRGIVLAMREIRAVQPAAQLVQTEDLGFTHAPATLQYQAAFENHRRWLAHDLLCGRVTDTHPLWNYLRRAGVTTDELRFFSAHPCPPDVLGMDYYLTSERYLDPETDNYPADRAGGNGRHRYVDVEAVRSPVPMSGAERLLTEAWERYRIPLAVTEVHLGCSRDEQMRWLYQAWHTGRRLIDKGVDFRAVTAWAALGSYDWNTLLTCETGYYEPGLFDVRSGQLRPTALAGLVRRLPTADAPEDVHPVASEPGWWQHGAHTAHARPLLVFTNSPAVRTAFSEICRLRGLGLRFGKPEWMESAGALHEALASRRPWAVVLADMPEDAADADPLDEAYAPLPDAAPLAEACREAGLPLLALSADPHRHGPLAHQESVIRRILPDALFIRTGPWLNPWHPAPFVQEVLAYGETEHLPDDVSVSPVYVPEMLHASLDLLLDDARGPWHLAHSGRLSWAAFASRLAGLAPPDQDAAGGEPPAGPNHMALSGLGHALDRFRQHLEAVRVPQTAEA